MSSVIHDVVELVGKGWRPYRGLVEKRVYDGLKCGLMPASAQAKKKPYWFNRGDIFVCIGCYKKCSLNRPEGFQPPLEINYEQDRERPMTLAPQELVRAKPLLRTDEAAYCLNISRNRVFKMISSGRLRALKDKPLRVDAAEVEKLMNDFDDV